MKILMAVRNEAPIGGAEAYQYGVSRLLLGRGHDVAWLCEHRTSAASVPLPCSRIWHAGDSGDRNAVNTWRPDVVFLQGLDSAAVEKRLVESVPTVLFAHNYHGTCPAGTKRHFFPTNTPCDRNISSACLALYLPRRCGGRNPLTLVALYREQMAHRAILDRCKAIVVGSHHMLGEYQRLGLRRADLHLIPLGVDRPPVVPSEPRELGQTIRIGFLGRLTDLKGGDVLLQAVRLAAGRVERSIGIRIVGDGPDRGKLERLASRLRIETSFSGWVATEAMDAELANIDLLAVPSVWAEPFGLVGIEAAWRGIPAVAFDVGGVSDWLRSGQTGEIAPGAPPRPVQLADAIVRAVADEEHYRQLSKGALQNAPLFSLERHVETLDTLLRQVANPE